MRICLHVFILCGGQTYSEDVNLEKFTKPAPTTGKYIKRFVELKITFIKNSIVNDIKLLQPHHIEEYYHYESHGLFWKNRYMH